MTWTEGRAQTYEREVMNEIRQAVVDDFTSFLAAGHGAPPTLVTELARKMDLRWPTRVVAEAAYDFTPELHALLYEWYFTQPSARYLAEVALGAGHSWVYLGAPSAAHEMSKAIAGVRLIDANPAVLDRFAGIAERADVTIAEVGDAFTELSDVAVIDPPWYPADVARWISIAARHIRPGGAIVSTLFPALTRPSAADEREAIFRVARTYGRIEFRQSVLSYSTPLFERESLRASGISDPGDWRRADVLVIRGVEPRENMAAPQGAHRGLSGWDRYVIGTQVVVVSRAPTAAPGAGDEGRVLRPIAGCVDNVLPSVSERDPLRQQVGVWTSRNRVCATTDPEPVRRYMEVLAGSADSPGGGKAHGFLAEADQAFLRQLIGRSHYP